MRGSCWAGSGVAGFGLFPQRALLSRPFRPRVSVLVFSCCSMLSCGSSSEVGTRIYQPLPGSSDLGKSSAGTCRLSEYESRVYFCPIHRSHHLAQLSLDIVSLILLPIPFPFRAKTRRKVLYSQWHLKSLPLSFYVALER